MYLFYSSRICNLLCARRRLGGAREHQVLPLAASARALREPARKVRRRPCALRPVPTLIPISFPFPTPVASQVTFAAARSSTSCITHNAPHAQRSHSFIHTYRHNLLMHSFTHSIAHTRNVHRREARVTSASGYRSPTLSSRWPSRSLKCARN